MALDVQVDEREGGVLVVALNGELSVGDVDNLDVSLTSAISRRPKLTVFDLTRLTFISSLGMGKMVTYMRSVTPHGGRAVLAGANELVGQALERGHLTEVFETFVTVDDAIAEALSS